MQATATYPLSVISNYPPGGSPQDSNDWPALQNPGRPDENYPPSALCSCTFETAGAGRYTVRLGQSGRRFSTNLDVPRKSCFVAAGFFIAHGSIVDNVGFDPFMPFLFMGAFVHWPRLALRLTHAHARAQARSWHSAHGFTPVYAWNTQRAADRRSCRGMTFTRRRPTCLNMCARCGALQTTNPTNRQGIRPQRKVLKCARDQEANARCFFWQYASVPNSGKPWAKCTRVQDCTTR